ncbi:MAG TPA: acetate--CoA ligase family protein [Anaerolineae bacterium]
MTSVGASPNLAPLLHARSVAIVGISRPDRFGGQLYANLRNFGYQGRIYGVNPGYKTLYGQPCYPSLSALPQRPDCALLAIANERLLPVFQETAELGIPAAVIFGSAYSEPIDGLTLQDNLACFAHENSIVVCGPNCMGFLSFGPRLAVSGYPVKVDVPAGHVTLISHSGSVFESMVQNNRGVTYNYAISSGNEMTTTLADYMLYALDDPATRVIALFLETVRDPERFIAALARAAARNVPVVALKVGRSRLGAHLAQAHSGALAGEDAVYDALLSRYSVRRVKSLDEMMDTLELLAAHRQVPEAAVAAILDSGGERALLVDLAQEIGVPFASLSEDTKAKLSQVLEPGLDPVNPLDAWGTGNDYSRIYRDCLLALDADPAVGLTLLAVDLMRESTNPPTYPDIVLPLLSQLTKPLALLVNATAAASEDQMARLRQAGIPVLMGTETGLRTVRHLLEYSSRHRRNLTAEEVGEVEVEINNSALSTVKDVHGDRLLEFRRQLEAAAGPLDEYASKQILQAYGLPVVTEALVASLDEVLQAAKTIGYPVALKTAAGIGHKSDVDGVRLNLGSETALAAAYRDMAKRLGAPMVVQQMVAAGVELLLGLVRDEQFGPVLILGSGGILVEVLQDTRLLLLPTTPDEIRQTLLSLRIAPLLAGARGRPAVDLEAIVTTAMRLATLAADLGDLTAAVDVNPLIARPDGVVVVDALIVPRRISRNEL